MRSVFAVAAIKAGSLITAGVLPLIGLAGPTRTPSELLSQALAAARAQSSVQWVAVNKFPGEVATTTTKAGSTSGIQTISLTEGGQTGHLTVELLTNQTAYLKGDSFALRYYMGFKAAPATKEANLWLSLSPSNGDYAEVAAGLTVKSSVDQMEMTGPLTAVAPTVVRGEDVDGVRGVTKASPGYPAMKAVIYIRAKGTALPVEQKLAYGLQMRRPSQTTVRGTSPCRR